MARNGRIGLLFACASGITACGGGGGSGSSPAPPPPAMAFPVAAAISAYSQSNHAFNLTGSYNDTTLSATLTFTPGMSAMFEGQTTSTATTSVTIAQNGTTISSGTSVSFFTLNPFKQMARS